MPVPETFTKQTLLILIYTHVRGRRRGRGRVCFGNLVATVGLLNGLHNCRGLQKAALMCRICLANCVYVSVFCWPHKCFMRLHTLDIYSLDKFSHLSQEPASCPAAKPFEVKFFGY